MTSIRKNYTAKFKRDVALALIREDATISELSARYGVHQSVMQRWKRQALENIEGIFSGKIEKQEQSHLSEINRLHQKIGQLTIEKDFLEEASSRLGLLGGKK